MIPGLQSRDEPVHQPKKQRSKGTWKRCETCAGCTMKPLRSMCHAFPYFKKTHSQVVEMVRSRPGGNVQLTDLYARVCVCVCVCVCLGAGLFVRVCTYVSMTEKSDSAKLIVTFVCQTYCYICICTWVSCFQRRGTYIHNLRQQRILAVAASDEATSAEAPTRPKQAAGAEAHTRAPTRPKQAALAEAPTGPTQAVRAEPSTRPEPKVRTVYAASEEADSAWEPSEGPDGAWEPSMRRKPKARPVYAPSPQATGAEPPTGAMPKARTVSTVFSASEQAGRAEPPTRPKPKARDIHAASEPATGAEPSTRPKHKARTSSAESKKQATRGKRYRLQTRGQYVQTDGQNGQVEDRRAGGQAGGRTYIHITSSKQNYETFTMLGLYPRLLCPRRKCPRLSKEGLQQHLMQLRTTAMMKTRSTRTTIMISMVVMMMAFHSFVLQALTLKSIVRREASHSTPEGGEDSSHHGQATPTICRPQAFLRETTGLMNSIPGQHWRQHWKRTQVSGRWVVGITATNAFKTTFFTRMHRLPQVPPSHTRSRKSTQFYTCTQVSK